MRSSRLNKCARRNQANATQSSFNGLAPSRINVGYAPSAVYEENGLPERSPKEFRMGESTRVGDRAVEEVSNWLSRLPQTQNILNVERVPEYRMVDVDLVWTTTDGAKTKVEIKGDRHDKTGNFFFETISNHELGKPGWMVYTLADYIFYYFVRTGMLYVLPMPLTKEWFLANLDRFPQHGARTRVGGRFYTTYGRAVPIREVLVEVPHIEVVQL